MYPNNLRDLRFPRPHHTITPRIGPSPLGAKDLQGAEWEVIQGHRVENLPEFGPGMAKTCGTFIACFMTVKHID